MQKSSYSSKKRLLFIFIVISALSLLLVFRLGYLQIVKGEELKKSALQQWTKGITIKSKRGVIYDRKGQKLAVSISASTVWASPAEVREGDPEEIASEIARVLNLDKDVIYEKITKNIRTERIKQWITREEAIELRKLKLQGIEIVDDNKRYYPYGNFASYILGFTDIDSNGLYGIERTYDEYLSGKPGRWIKTTDAPGRQLPFDNEKIYDPSDGLSVVLTMDETIQHFAEKAANEALKLNQAKNVSIIVMDPNTGDILAMAGKPDYDPNDPRMPVDESKKKQWESLPPEKLQEEWYNTWRNFSINDIYEPGSTFKLVTTAAALEENIATPQSHYYCGGFIKDIKGATLKCSRWYNPHGDQTLIEGLNNSCNIVFINVGRSLGKESFYKYIKAFGFGENTNIDLNGEQKGIIPSSVENIKEVNLATMSYGYGVAITPIQLITAVSSMVNGGNLMEPRIVKQLVDEKGLVQKEFEPVIKRKVISKKTSDEMRMMMEKVVSEGTGSNAYLPGYRVGGKTGTAQKIVDGRYVQGKYMASFVAVAPADDPQVAILVVIDEPGTGQYYGGTVAAPVAKDVLNEILKYLEVIPKFSEEEKKDIVEMVSVPDVRNMEIGKAGKLLNSIGLKYTTEYLEMTERSKVLDQFPLQGIEVKKGSIIDLYLHQSKNDIVLTPYLIGKSKDEVIKTLDDMHLNYELTGDGEAISQQPLPGEEISDNTKIKVEFQQR